MSSINISEYIEEYYPNVSQIKKIKIKKSINSINYNIQTKNDNYILRNFLDGSKPLQIEKICKIMNFCKKRNVKVIEPLKNKKGSFVDTKKLVYLSKFYEGKLFSGNPKQIQSLAKNLAVLHSVLKINKISYNYRTNYQYYKTLNFKELQKIKKRLKNINPFEKNLSNNYEFLIKCFNEDEKKTSILKRHMPKKQLIHHDLHPGNVIFDRNEVSAIIDFNSLRKGLPIEDITFASVRFGSYNNSNKKRILDRIRNFVETYTAYNEIENNQLKEFNFYFSHEILSRISYILRMKYFRYSELWLKDFGMFLKFLKLAQTMILFEKI